MRIMIACVGLITLLLLGACSAAAPATASAPIGTAGANEATQALMPDLLPAEPPPGGAEREFTTDFSCHSVAYTEILSGGPPKDGIPAIDNPKFVTPSGADSWLGPQEPVILVQVNDEARAYPIQILMWHEADQKQPCQP